MYIFYVILIPCTSNVQFRVDLYLSIQVSCQTTPKFPLLITSRPTAWIKCACSNPWSLAVTDINHFQVFDLESILKRVRINMKWLSISLTGMFLVGIKARIESVLCRVSQHTLTNKFRIYIPCRKDKTKSPYLDAIHHTRTTFPYSFGHLQPNVTVHL